MVAAKMTKTIVVEVSRRVPHPLYRRIIGKRKKFYAHDEKAAIKASAIKEFEIAPASKIGY